MAPCYAKFTVGWWKNGLSWDQRFCPCVRPFFWTVPLKLSSVRNKYDYSSFSLIFACLWVCRPWIQSRQDVWSGDFKRFLRSFAVWEVEEKHQIFQKVEERMFQCSIVSPLVPITKFTINGWCNPPKLGVFCRVLPHCWGCMEYLDNSVRMGRTSG